MKAAAVDVQGPAIESHFRSPRRVNAGFMQIVCRSRIRLRVWERSAGETLAFGTGSLRGCGNGHPTGWIIKSKRRCAAACLLSEGMVKARSQ